MKKEIIQLHERFKQETIVRPRPQNYSVYVSQRKKKPRPYKRARMILSENMNYIQEHERKLETIKGVVEVFHVS